MDKQDRLHPKYVATLAAVSVVILGLGIALRPAKKTIPPQPSETLRLQRRLRGEELRSLTNYLGERATAAAETMVYLPETGESGIVWSGREVVAVPRHPRDLLPLRVISGSFPGRPVMVDAGGALQDPVIAVTKNQRGEALWVPTVYLGERDAHCGAARYVEVVLGIPYDRQWDGAGVFTLEGGLVGVAGRCGDRRTVVAGRSIGAVLERWWMAGNRLESEYGMGVKPVNAAWQSYVRRDSGLVVSTVWSATLASRAGLRVGDVITSVNQTPVATPEELANILGKEGKTLQVARGRRVVDVTLEPARERAITFEDTPALPPVQVDPDTAAYRAGLRSGDRVIELDGQRLSTSGQFQRFLASIKRPSLLVVRRGEANVGVLIEP